MEYTVVIRKRNCKGAEYNDCFECPLAKAIKEQLPLLNFILVGSYYVFIDRKAWTFKKFLSSDGWNKQMMDKILSGEIKKCTVTFTSPNHLEELSEENVKEASKIVNEVLVEEVI